MVELPPTSRPSPIRAVAFARDRLVPYRAGPREDSWLVATAEEGTEVVIWDLRRRLPRTYCRGSIWTVNTLEFHPDGLMLVSGGQALATLWDVARGMHLLRVSTGANQVGFSVFDREGTRLAFGTEPGAWTPVVGLWEMQYGRGIHPLLGLKAAARKVWFSPNGHRLAALSDDWHLGVWSMDSFRLLSLLEAPVGFLADNAGGAFDARGQRFAFASGHEACLFDLAGAGVIGRWSLGRSRVSENEPPSPSARKRSSSDHSSRIWLCRWSFCTRIK